MYLLKKTFFGINAMVIASNIIFTIFVLAFNSNSHISAYAQERAKSTEGQTHFLVSILRGPYHSQDLLVNLFKPYMTPKDYVFTKPDDRNLGSAFQLSGVKGVEYFSLAQIESNAEALKAKGVEFISYDIEPAYTPSDEMANPVSSVKSASDIVHKAGLLFMVSTTRKLDLQYASQFAAVSDFYNPQGQALQSSPSEYASFYKDIAAQIRTANPHIKIVAQVSTLRGDLQSMQQSFSLVADFVDGVIVWYATTPDSLKQLNSFLNWFSTNNNIITTGKSIIV